MWLYGSRAEIMASDNSDYDLAVAFNKPLANVLDNRLRPEVLTIKWQEFFLVDISIFDINLAPIANCQLPIANCNECACG
jgi:predicted nucleotidyltransferase